MHSESSLKLPHEAIPINTCDINLNADLEKIISKIIQICLVIKFSILPVKTFIMIIGMAMGKQAFY